MAVDTRAARVSGATCSADRTATVGKNRRLRRNNARQTRATAPLWELKDPQDPFAQTRAVNAHLLIGASFSSYFAPLFRASSAARSSARAPARTPRMMS